MYLLFRIEWKIILRVIIMYKISDCQLFSNKRVAKGFSVNLIPNLIPRVLHLPAPLAQELERPWSSLVTCLLDNNNP